MYHYHVQPRAPFTIGCFGPATTGAGAETLVTLEACRSLYSGCQTTDPETVTTSAGASDYALWCPCYDGQGSNVGTATLAVFAAGSGETVTCSNCSSGGVLPTGGTGGGGGGGGPATDSAGSHIGRGVALCIPGMLMLLVASVLAPQ